MIRRVRLRHPVTCAEINAPEGVVDLYRRSGWQPVDELADESDAEAGDAADGATAEATPTTTATTTPAAAGESASAPSGEQAGQEPGGLSEAAAADSPPQGQDGLGEGGVLQPGFTETRNATGAPEPVLTQGQSAPDQGAQDQGDDAKPSRRRRKTEPPKED